MVSDEGCKLDHITKSETKTGGVTVKTRGTGLGQKRVDQLDSGDETRSPCLTLTTEGLGCAARLDPLIGETRRR